MNSLNAVVMIYFEGLSTNWEYLGIAGSHETKTDSEMQNFLAPAIMQHVSEDHPQYRWQKKAVTWDNREKGIIFIGETPENEVQFDFKLRFRTSSL